MTNFYPERSELAMLKDIEKKFNNWIIDFVIWWSYLNDYRQRFFENIKKTGRDAYAHMLTQLERLKKWYRN